MLGIDIQGSDKPVQEICEHAAEDIEGTKKISLWYGFMFIKLFFLLFS